MINHNTQIIFEYRSIVTIMSNYLSTMKTGQIVRVTGQLRYTLLPNQSSDPIYECIRCLKHIAQNVDLKLHNGMHNYTCKQCWNDMWEFQVHPCDVFREK